MTEMTMRAAPGDWLVVAGSTDSRHERRAQVLDVPDPAGRPPYRVRWLDTGHEALMYPGPDSHVVTAAEQAERDRAASERVEAVQADLAEHAEEDGT